MRALAHRCADRRSGLLARALFAQPQSCKIELRQLRTLRTGHSSRMPHKRGTEWFGQVSGVRPSRSTSARRCSATQTWLPTPVCGCTSATLTALGSAAPVKTQTGCCASSCPSTPACRSTPMTTSTPSPTASTRGRAARATGRRLCTCSHRARQAHIDLELMRNQATSGSSAKPPSLRASGRAGERAALHQGPRMAADTPSSSSPACRNPNSFKASEPKRPVPNPFNAGNAGNAGNA